MLAEVNLEQVGLGDCSLFPGKETMANYVMDVYSFSTLWFSVPEFSNALNHEMKKRVEYWLYKG